MKQLKQAVANVVIYKKNQMINKCPFLQQLRYCYASAEISSEGEFLHIRFNQELNIDNGADILRFLLMPLSELSNIECRYMVSIATPSQVHSPCIISLLNGEVIIENAKSMENIAMAS